MLINVHVEMFGKRHDFVPSVVFFNLRADYESGFPRGIERANDFLESSRIRLHDLRNLTRANALAFVSPVIHRNGNKDRPHGRLHGEVVAARNRCRHVLGAKRLIGPFHVGLYGLNGATHKKWLSKNVASILLSGRHNQRGVAVVRINQCRKAITDASNGMHIRERGFAAAHRVSQCHADRGAFMESEDVVKVPRDVAKKRQFRRAGVAEDAVHSQLAQDLIRDFSYRLQCAAP